MIVNKETKGRFTHNMPRPCHAVPLRVQNVSFPFDLHNAAVSDSHLPCHAHAIPDHAILLKATAQHGRRERACGLTSRFRLLPAITRSSTKLKSHAYQSQMQVASVKPNTVVMDDEKSGSSTLQKRRSVTLLDQQFGYFRLPCGHSRRTRHCRSRAGARHGICELTYGALGERHATCESAFNILFVNSITCFFFKFHFFTFSDK